MPQVSFDVVGANYFETMRIPLTAGRGISDADIASKAPVAVITESMARQLWPDESAVGKRFRLAGSQDNGFEVVGVSRNVKYYMIGDDARALMFLPVTKMPQDFTFVNRLQWGLASVLAGLETRAYFRRMSEPWIRGGVYPIPG